MFQKKFLCGKKAARGFTLVEIIVVLVILAILAAATIPSLLGFIDDAKFKTIDNEARVVRNAAQAYATEYSAKGETDEDIASAINGVINSNHALHNLLQNDANGTVFETKVEKGKIKKFNYTKEIINDDEDYINDKVRYAIFDDSKSSLLHATGTVASINNIESFKADLKADLLRSLTEDIAEMETNLNSNLESSMASFETSLTTSLSSSLESGMDTKISALNFSSNTDLGKKVLDFVYPVGSYYISNSSTSPATLFGGTWTQIVDKFLYCTASGAGATGGSSTHTHTTGDHTLTIDQIPNHRHNLGRSDFFVFGGPENSTCIQRSGGFATPLSSLWTTYVGGGQAHNHGNTGSASNLPPYMKVYCWQRTE